MAMSSLAEKTGTVLITYGNITDVVADRIRDMIVNGELQPGEWLKQAELAQALGVSTMPVREALRQLQAEGLVVFYPRRGARVAQLSISEFLELDLILEELEVLACKWIAEEGFRRLPLDHMKQVLAELEEAERRHDVPQRLKCVRQFKFALYRAANKAYLLQLISALFDRGAQYRRVFSEVSELTEQRIQAYRNIYQACEAGDLTLLTQRVRELYALARQAIISRLSAQAC